ncbi:MAG: hypothetical protein KF868_05760 [Acidobacteria bacterium]|nr:hypothetical protein [Acidobacteriota bacterium]MCW5970527.1 hypothetical protein [Blastocatellales bacterium]
MKATYRPKIRNGSVSRRPVRNGHLGRAGWMPQSRRPQAVWALVILGGLIAGGFLTSLRWQLRALDTTRKAVELKSTLDQAESERRYLTVAEGGARNPIEIERAVNRGGAAAMTRAHLDDPSVLVTARRAAAAAQAQAAREKARKESRTARIERDQSPVVLPLPAETAAPVRLAVPPPAPSSIQQ